MEATKLLGGIFFLLLSSSLANAQVADKTRPAFHSINNLGLLNGSKSAALQLQTIEGIGYKNWFAGVGVALDYYRYRTVPAFIDLRHYFGKTRNKWFVYGDGGVAYPWLTDKQKNDYYAPQDKFRGRYYYDLGAGYNIAIGKRHALSFSAGFSQMKLREDRTVYNFYPYMNANQQITSGPPTETYNYTLKRLTIKAGFSF